MKEVSNGAREMSKGGSKGGVREGRSKEGKLQGIYTVAKQPTMPTGPCS